MEERFFKFSNLSSYPEIIHGISKRSYGDMKLGHRPEEEIIKNREQFFQDLGIPANQIVISQQVHSSHIIVVDKPSPVISATDGLITAAKGLSLMITVADCLPVLIYDPMQKVVGILHAGWRGIIKQIVIEAIEQLDDLGSEPENLIVGIGPGICQKHFIVKNDVLEKFLDFYPSATFVRNNDGYVDLKKAVLIDLKKKGVLSGNIEVSGVCPSCDNGIYGSFRKEGESVLASAAIIGMRVTE